MRGSLQALPPWRHCNANPSAVKRRSRPAGALADRPAAFPFARGRERRATMLISCWSEGARRQSQRRRLSRNDECVHGSAWWCMVVHGAWRRLARASVRRMALARESGTAWVHHRIRYPRRHTPANACHPLPAVVPSWLLFGRQAGRVRPNHLPTQPVVQIVPSFIVPCAFICFWPAFRRLRGPVVYLGRASRTPEPAPWAAASYSARFVRVRGRSNRPGQGSSSGASVLRPASAASSRPPRALASSLV